MDRDRWGLVIYSLILALVFCIFVFVASRSQASQEEDALKKVAEALAQTEPVKERIKKLERHVPEPVKEWAPEVGIAYRLFVDRTIKWEWEW